MGTWSSGHGKFLKKDPDHGKWWGWLKDNWKGFWEASIYNKCCRRKCKCKNENTEENLFKD